MCEHNQLKPVVRHVFSKTTVALYHGQSKVFLRTLYGQRPLAIGIPIRKERRQPLLVPRKKPFRELFIIDGVGVGGICDPEVSNIFGGACIQWYNLSS